MDADTAGPTPGPVLQRDAEILIGILAILEGAVWAGDLDGRIVTKIAERFAEHGVLAAGHSEGDLREAIGDMNQRLRYSAGDYDSPPQ